MSAQPVTAWLLRRLSGCRDHASSWSAAITQAMRLALTLALDHLEANPVIRANRRDAIALLYLPMGVQALTLRTNGHSEGMTEITCAKMPKQRLKCLGLRPG